jgi:hypothetical protein
LISCKINVQIVDVFINFVKCAHLRVFQLQVQVINCARVKVLQKLKASGFRIQYFLSHEYLVVMFVPDLLKIFVFWRNIHVMNSKVDQYVSCIKHVGVWVIYYNTVLPRWSLHLRKVAIYRGVVKRGSTENIRILHFVEMSGT